MTGSGFPQRFADLDGTMIDVYQSMTQVSDEMDARSCRRRRRSTRCSTTRSARRSTGASSTSSCTPTSATTGAQRRSIGDAQSRGVPIVTSAQMLRWLDGRNGSSFGDIAYSNGQLTLLAVGAGQRARPAGHAPARSANGPLTKLRRDGQPVSWKRRTVKGVDYVMFDATAGAYTATYATDTSAPEISGVSATADAEGHAVVEWTTDEPSTSIVEYGRTTALGLRARGHRRGDRAPRRAHGPLARDHLPLPRRARPTAAGNCRLGAGHARHASRRGRRRRRLADGGVRRRYTGPAPTPATPRTGPDGEVQLQPAVGDEFSGSALSSTWLTRPWQPGGWALVPGRRPDRRHRASSTRRTSTRARGRSSSRPPSSPSTTRPSASATTSATSRTRSSRPACRATRPASTP